MIDTAGVYRPFFDMCGYCKMTTGGSHQPNCPLFQPPKNYPPIVRIETVLDGLVWRVQRNYVIA